MMKTCFTSADVLRSAVDDVSYLLFYLEFFRNAGATAYDLHKLFSENDAKIFYDTAISVMLEVNEDCWIVENSPDEGLVLWHNNYEVNPDLTRTFTDGFHRQYVYDVSDFGFFARKMAAYSWKAHQDTLREYNEDMRRRRIRARLAVADNFTEEPSLSSRYSYFTFAYYGEDITRPAREAHVGLEVIEKYPPDSRRFCVIKCRVFKSQENAFLSLMQRIKTDCPEELMQDYLDLCEETIPQIG